MTMKVISLGLGIQSTAMYMMSCRGEIERADVAIFADVGLEHPETYKTLDWLRDRGDIPIHILRERNLHADIMAQDGRRVASLPAFTTTGMIRRQCTAEYKIQPINKKIRELHGLPKGARMLPTSIMIGISTDEGHRMKDNPNFNMENRYPLIDLGWDRSDGGFCFVVQSDRDLPPRANAYQITPTRKPRLPSTQRTVGLLL